MITRLLIAALLSLLCAAAQADDAAYKLLIQQAQFFTPPGPPPSKIGYTGTCDHGATCLHYYGLRAASSSTGVKKAIHYTCTGGSPSSGDINVLANGNLDISTLTTACGSNVPNMYFYDQVGTNDLSNLGVNGTQILTSTSFDCASFAVSISPDYCTFFNASNTATLQSVANDTISSGYGISFVAWDDSAGATLFAYNNGTEQSIIVQNDGGCNGGHGYRLGASTFASANGFCGPSTSGGGGWHQIWVAGAALIATSASGSSANFNGQTVSSQTANFGAGTTAAIFLGGSNASSHLTSSGLAELAIYSAGPTPTQQGTICHDDMTYWNLPTANGSC